jgi:hypothetical protein
LNTSAEPADCTNIKAEGRGAAIESKSLVGKDERMNG